VDPNRDSYALAPMSTSMRLTTALCLLGGVALPVIMVISTPVEFARWFVPVTTVLLWGTFAGVWAFGRPWRFDILPVGLEIVWPLRRKLIAAGDIVEAAMVDRDQLGSMIRLFGAGGLFGGFGLFRSSRLANLDVYISRSDGLVLIRRRSARPLLISPQRPEDFVRAMQGLLFGD